MTEKESEDTEIQLLIQVKEMMPVGWGYYMLVELLEIKQGDLPPIDPVFEMGWTVGFVGRTVGKQGIEVYPELPAKGEKFLITFFKNGTINEKVFTAPITGFTDKISLIWFVKTVQKIPASK